MVDPVQDYEQIISNFEQQQADYQAALQAREDAKRNEELQREAYFYEQRRIHEEGQKRDRRCDLVEKCISTINSIIQEIEWGSSTRLNEKLRNLEDHMNFQIVNKMLKEGR